MSIELHLARNAALTRSLNERVALIAESSETFGPLKFLCECGIYDCGEQIELTASAYEDIRLEPTHFLVHPDHVVYAVEVVVEYAGSHVVVQKVGAAARLAIATDPRDVSEEPLARDLDARIRS
jgi:hypothetical protein